jgi:hypothetical protein
MIGIMLVCVCVCCYCCRYVLDMARVRHIVPDPSDDNLRLVIFSDLVTDIHLQGLPEEKQQALKKVVIADVVPYDVVLDYPYWPVGKSFISSFFSTSRKQSKL